jgi:hypothetical protein
VGLEILEGLSWLVLKLNHALLFSFKFHTFHLLELLFAEANNQIILAIIISLILS